MRVDITPSDVDICPKCSSLQVGCVESKNLGEGRRRRKKCKVCGAVYHTIEITEEEYNELARLIITDRRLLAHLLEKGIVNVSTS